jgi:hypothetical protein
MSILILCNYAEKEYEGVFTGDVETIYGVISEEELKNKYNIILKQSFTIRDGYECSSLLNDVHDLKFEEGPYSKVIVINAHVSEDQPSELDYESED